MEVLKCFLRFDRTKKRPNTQIGTSAIGERIIGDGRRGGDRVRAGEDPSARAGVWKNRTAHCSVLIARAMIRRVLVVLLSGALAAGGEVAAQPIETAQQSALVENASAAQDPSASVVVQAHARGQQLGTGDVGAELVAGGASSARAYRPAQAATRTDAGALSFQSQEEEEVTTGEFTRGALIGGAAGLAAGALVGALLGGGERTARWEAALPGAMSGLAVGAPVGVYWRTDRAPRYRWGAAGVAGAAAAGTALYYAEAH